MYLPHQKMPTALAEVVVEAENITGSLFDPPTPTHIIISLICSWGVYIYGENFIWTYQEPIKKESILS